MSKASYAEAIFWVAINGESNLNADSLTVVMISDLFRKDAKKVLFDIGSIREANRVVKDGPDL